MKANIIFVLSKGRTGSTLMCQLSTHYQRVINFNEALFSNSNNLFRTSEKFSSFLNEKFGNDTLSEDDLKSKLLNDIPQLISTMSDYFVDETMVLKIHLSHRTFLENNLNWILSQPNHRFIVLDRNDYLKTYVSEEIARQSDIWHHEDTSDKKIKIDIPNFLSLMNAFKEQYIEIKKTLDSRSKDYLLVEYDKDLKNYNSDDFINLVDPWIKRTGLDLQLGDAPVVSSKRQNINENIFNNIINHEEIKELLENIDKLGLSVVRKNIKNANTNDTNWQWYNDGKINYYLKSDDSEIIKLNLKKNRLIE